MSNGEVCENTRWKVRGGRWIEEALASGGEMWERGARAADSGQPHARVGWSGLPGSKCGMP